MMTQAALTTPPAARPLPAPAPLLPFDAEAAPSSPIADPARWGWSGWQGDLRFFLTAYLAGFVFFLAILS